TQAPRGRACPGHPRRPGQAQARGFGGRAHVRSDTKIFLGGVDCRPARTSSSRWHICHSTATMESAMKYMLLIYSDEKQWQGLSQSETGQRMAAYRAYTEALTKAGALVAGDRLQRADAATTVRVNNSKTNVLNGPYAETREQLGGYYLIEA